MSALVSRVADHLPAQRLDIDARADSTKIVAWRKFSAAARRGSN